MLHLKQLQCSYHRNWFTSILWLNFFFVLSFTLKNMAVIFLFWMWILSLKCLQFLLIHTALKQLFTEQCAVVIFRWWQVLTKMITNPETSRKIWFIFTVGKKALLWSVEKNTLKSGQLLFRAIKLCSELFQRRTKKHGIFTCGWYILPLSVFVEDKLILFKLEGYLIRKGIHLGSDTYGTCFLFCCRFTAWVYTGHPDWTWKEPNVKMQDRGITNMHNILVEL